MGAYETDTKLTLGLRWHKNMVYSKHCKVDQERGKDGGWRVWTPRPSPPQPSSRPGWRSGKRRLWGVCRVITAGSQIRVRFGEGVFGGTWGR